jgi:hypothetical protein
MAKRRARSSERRLLTVLLAISNRPYPPSWVDRLSGWVERSGLPGIVFYSSLYLALTLVIQVMGWLAGTAPFGVLNQQEFLYQIFALVAFYYMYIAPGFAMDAMRNFRPLLDVSEREFYRLKYSLAFLPAGLTNALTVVAFVASSIFAYASPALFGQSVEITLSYLVAQTLNWYFGVLAAVLLVYRLIHQMRRVNEIYALVATIDLYNLGPIYSLSSFMAKASFMLLVLVYSGLLSDPSNFEIDEFVQGSLVIAIVALAGFVLPLLGINRRLVAAKAEKLQESGREVRAAFERISREQGKKKLDKIGNTRQLVDAVIRKREYIQSISTWPWQSATLRNLLAGVFLPVMIWLIQQGLNRFIN